VPFKDGPPSGCGQTWPPFLWRLSVFLPGELSVLNKVSHGESSALMVATNVVNNALEIPLDEYLEPYRREER
jgi:hypothetical protein